VIETIRSLGQTKIITSHDPEVIAEVCTRVIELKK
jgi:ABC-type glutathione transport system ATPase component